MIVDSWPRKKREDFWIYRQEVCQLRASIKNAPFNKCFKLEWREHNKSDEETSDISPRGYSSPEVAQQQDIEVISIKEPDLEPHIILPLASSARKPCSQAGKRQAEK